MGRDSSALPDMMENSRRERRAGAPSRYFHVTQTHLPPGRRDRSPCPSAEDRMSYSVRTWILTQIVGNIPYDVSEEQLVNVFSEVGRVVDFRLVSDRDQGKFKGYGFCEYEGTNAL